ncbi:MULTISPECIES: prepilin-type N-terminal cleavage/methylation domain-containing protein [unclassified Cyanobium]|uniref:pilin n=1 Tax=unclassified Cyanobium TaxID=2627006 RepID=UPI002A47C9EF|nr:prepilin-type N-terminal cleavage/methylation domain-containing protein [Cyanobium sp. A2C-AMD]
MHLFSPYPRSGSPNNALRRCKSSECGLSLAELLIVIVILGIFAAITLESYNSFQRRERVNAVALSIYGWLNEVRQASLRLQDSGCMVTFASGSIAAGQQLASVETGSSCAAILGANSSLVLDRDLTNGLITQIGPSVLSVTYTPRTLSTNVSDITIGLTVDAKAPQRCLLVSAVSGSIQVGRNNSSSSTTGVCSYSTQRSI